MIKKIIMKIFMAHKYNSKSYIDYLRKKGVKVGKGTYFFDPFTTNVDVSNGIFIEIGQYCKITKGVNILAHDFSYSVLRRTHGEIPKKAAKTIIGNNVFIGINSIILMGSKIGENVIIGAGSVVSGTIPSNQVWGGNPAKFICTIDEYYRKSSSKFKDNSKLFVNEYNKKLNRNPSVEELQYFSTLFLDSNEESKMIYENMSFNGDEKQEVVKSCLNAKNEFANYDEFINWAKKND